MMKYISGCSPKENKRPTLRKGLINSSTLKATQFFSVSYWIQTSTLPAVGGLSNCCHTGLTAMSAG